MNYAKTIYMTAGSTFPTGEVFGRLVVLEDATFSTFGATWKVGNTETNVTATEIPSLTAAVYPGQFTDLVVTSGAVLLSRG